jgi:hypothetical protein
MGQAARHAIDLLRRLHSFPFSGTIKKNLKKIGVFS